MTDTKSTLTPHSHPKLNPRKIEKQKTGNIENHNFCESGVGSISHRSTNKHSLTSTSLGCLGRRMPRRLPEAARAIVVAAAAAAPHGALPSRCPPPRLRAEVPHAP